MALETDLAGRRALITGGLRGIGLAIARAFAAEHVKLAIADIEPDPGALEILNSLTGDVVSITSDVSKETEVVDLVRQAVTRLGGIDIFVNNVGLAVHQPVTKITREAFYKTVDTNLAACVWACREIAKGMIAQGSGSILIVGSTVRVCPAYGESSYRISKMGLKMYMETLAIELAPYGIRVNMITPGHFPTRLTANIPAKHEQVLKSQIPLRRFGKPEELGAVAVLLASERFGSYVTGADYTVDGGLSLRPLPVLEEERLFRLNLDEGNNAEI